MAIVSLSSNEILVSRVANGFAAQVAIDNKEGKHVFQSADELSQFVTDWAKLAEGPEKEKEETNA